MRYTCVRKVVVNFTLCCCSCWSLTMASVLFLSFFFIKQFYVLTCPFGVWFESTFYYRCVYYYCRDPVSSFSIIDMCCYPHVHLSLLYTCELWSRSEGPKILFYVIVLLQLKKNFLSLRQLWPNFQLSPTLTKICLNCSTTFQNRKNVLLTL